MAYKHWAIWGSWLKEKLQVGREALLRFVRSSGERLWFHGWVIWGSWLEEKFQVGIKQALAMTSCCHEAGCLGYILPMTTTTSMYSLDGMHHPGWPWPHPLFLLRM